MTHEGFVRFIVHKIVEDGKANVEVFEHDEFDYGFETSRCRFGPMNFASEIVADCGHDEQLLMVLEKYPEGFYEVVGELHYEYDPGTDTPNGPAEPDVWWWIDNAKIAALTEEQVEWYLPKKDVEESSLVLDKNKK